MALGSKKGFTAKQSRRTSRRMEDSTVGTHVRRSAAAQAPRSTGASGMSFSNSRAASASHVSSVRGSYAQQDAYAYRARTSQHRYMEAQARRTRRKRIVVALIVALVVAAAAVGAGVLAFMGSVGSTMALRDSDARDALSAPMADQPYYVLVSAELGAVAVPLDNGGPDVVLLMRVDEQQGTLAVVSIPHNLSVQGSDNQRHRIEDFAQTGDAALINAVEKFAEVNVSHFVKIGPEGLAGLVDYLGGIDVALTQEIDDPHAGDLYFAPGEYTLSGKQALVYLRTSNLTLGQRDQMDNQVRFALQMLEKLFAGSDSISFATRLDAIGSYFQTDYSSGDLVALADKFKDLSASQVYWTVAPGYVDIDTTVTGEQGTYYISAAADMRSLLAAIDAGEEWIDPHAEEEVAVNPASFTLEIQNGANIVGAAAATQSSLEQKGFNVIEIGNAEQSVYDETLVVYLMPENAPCAKAVVDALGAGRVVDGSAYYEFEADVLLILGKDYKPIA